MCWMREKDKDWIAKIEDQIEETYCPYCGSSRDECNGYCQGPKEDPDKEYREAIEALPRFIRGEMTVWELMKFFDSVIPFPESKEEKEVEI